MRRIVRMKATKDLMFPLEKNSNIECSVKKAHHFCSGKLTSQISGIIESLVECKFMSNNRFYIGYGNAGI